VNQGVCSRPCVVSKVSRATKRDRLQQGPLSVWWGQRDQLLNAKVWAWENDILAKIFDRVKKIANILFADNQKIGQGWYRKFVTEEQKEKGSTEGRWFPGVGDDTDGAIRKDRDSSHAGESPRRVKEKIGANWWQPTKTANGGHW